MVIGDIPLAGRDEIEWAPRVPKRKLRRLYESDARGLLDEELLDDVGTLLLQRCKSILIVADAQKGAVHCPRCERRGTTRLIERPRTHGDPRDKLLVCPACAWQATWGEYHLSFKRHQLNPGGATASFCAYVQNYAAAQTPQAKMIAIDRLIHEFHYSFVSLPDQPTRPVGVNLIEGSLSDVIEFLNELTSGTAMTVANEWQIRLAEFRQANERIREYIRQRPRRNHRKKKILQEATDWEPDPTGRSEA
jgi:hypothetical protein